MKKHASNCWKPLKTTKLQREYEIKLSVIVAKAERISLYWHEVKPPVPITEWEISSEAPNRRTFNGYPFFGSRQKSAEMVRSK